MARIAEITLTTWDEEYMSESRIGDQIQTALEALKLDTYNKQYVVQVTISTVDEPVSPSDDN